ncbi:MAG TPA: hypothetical protein VFQ53_21625 [Kofleriaceae bacterium]|nr:hypothetical protein [Kofleriaceae bacterium]
MTATPAHADRTSWHVTASGDVAATDNVFATTRDANESDVFFTVRPGVLFGYDAPKMIHDINLESEVLTYVLHTEKPSVSMRTGIRSYFVTGKYSSIITQINASNGVLTALTARNSPDQTGPVVTPLGRLDTQQADASEYFTYNTGRDVRLSQTLFGRASRSDDNADTASMGALMPTIVKSAEVGAALGFEKDFRNDTVNLEAGASVLRLERDADPSALQGPRLDRQLNPRARLQWRHDFSRRWSGVADGGAVYVHPFGKDPDNPDAKLHDGIFPIAGVTLAFSEVWGRAAFQARRDVTPNLFVAQNTVNDQGVLTLAMPLPWLDESNLRQPKLVGLGSIGIVRTQLIDPETGDLASSFVAGRLDVGVGYSPRPGFTYGIRYEFIYQTGDDQAVMAIPGFWRNTLSFTFAIRYPDRVVAQVPKRRTGSVRADGKDLVPIGVDPVTTDFVQEQDESDESTDR